MPNKRNGNGEPERRTSDPPAKQDPNRLRSVSDAERAETPGAEPTGGRRVEIMLDDELYDRVRIKAMRQRKSLRSLGAELFAAWANDETVSGNR